MTETKPLPRRGRPPLLTADKIRPLADAVERGKSRAEAARSAGVSFGHFMLWLGEGRRLHEAGADHRSALTSHAWMRLRLFKAVQEAEERRDRARAMEAHPSNGTGPKAVERPPMGRPPVLTDAVLNTVVASLSAGDGRAAAAAAAGVTRRTFQRWMARGARVHFSGSVLTEYERLCLALYRRVKDVKMEQAQGAAEPVPTLEEKGLLDLSTVPRELLEQHLLSMPANPTLSILPRRGPEIAPRLDMGKLPPGTRFEPLSADAIKAGVISADAITTNRVAPVKPWPDVVIEIGRPRGPVRRWLLSLLERAARAL